MERVKNTEMSKVGYANIEGAAAAIGIAPCVYCTRRM